MAWLNGQPTTLGFVAEEVEAVSPLLAAYTDEGELRSVKYAQMSALTVKAIQELAARLGVVRDSGTITIGQQGTQTGAFIAGIRGITPGNADAVPVLIYSNGQLGTMSSSIRYKEDVRDMGDVTPALMRLRPVTFRYTHTFNGGVQPLQYGLIAEEVAEIFPGLVVFNEDGLPETVQYRKVNAMLLNEVQKLHRQNEAQQTVIDEMRASEGDLQRQIDDLMQRLETLEAVKKSTGKKSRKWRRPEVLALGRENERLVDPAAAQHGVGVVEDDRLTRRDGALRLLEDHRCPVAGERLDGGRGIGMPMPDACGDLARRAGWGAGDPVDRRRRQSGPFQRRTRTHGERVRRSVDGQDVERHAGR